MVRGWREGPGIRDCGESKGCMLGEGEQVFGWNFVEDVMRGWELWAKTDI